MQIWFSAHSSSLPCKADPSVWYFRGGGRANTTQGPPDLNTADAET